MTLPKGQGGVSPDLQRAQARLMQWRKSLREQRAQAGQTARTDLNGRPLAPASLPAPAATPETPLVHLRETLPAHLGWHSQPLANALARAAEAPAQRARLSPPPDPPPPAPATPAPPTVPLYPDLALAMLRREAVSPGRLWLLLRFLDKPGRGWLAEPEIRKLLTGPEAAWPLCGARQLRNLLAQGDGLFWRRQDGRLWLRSVARVAQSLGVARFQAAAVQLPVSILLSRIGEVRAHFYASFHSSRVTSTEAGKRVARPIARRTLEKIAHVSRHTQRRYETAAGVRRQTNLAVGAPLSATLVEERAQQHGRAFFSFKDHQGRLGRAGQAYVAWQLPNSYLGPHQRKSRQQRRRLNRQLAGLLQEGTTGNGKEETSETRHRSEQRFHRNGRQAARTHAQNPAADAYWPERRYRRGAHFWHLLPATVPPGRRQRK